MYCRNDDVCGALEEFRRPRSIRMICECREIRGKKDNWDRGCNCRSCCRRRERERESRFTCSCREIR